MSHPLASIHRAMSNDSDLVRLIAENIANAQTSGYQRKFGVQQVQFEALGTKESAGKASTMAAALSVVTDATPGTLSETREPLDVALDGVGSLVVAGEDGESLVRGGRLHIDDQGFLVTAQGLQIQGSSGPINFAGNTVDAGSLKISGDGVISLGGDIVGQLQVRAGSDAEGAQVPRVKQGFVETSNVDPVTEMLKLMEIVRHFEATQKVARSYNDLMQQGIADLGKI